MSGRPSRWRGEALAELRRWYEDGELEIVEVAVNFRTSPGNVCRVARRNGWKPRGPGRLPAIAHQQELSGWYLAQTRGPRVLRTNRRHQ